MENKKQPVSIQETVQEIREKILASLSTPASPVRPTPAPAPFGLPKRNLSSLRESAQRLKNGAGMVGQMPPQPPGLRGRVGALLVQIVRRMLFWYTPQIVEFQNASANAIEALAATAAAGSTAFDALLARVVSMQTGLDERLKAQSEQLRRLETQVHTNVEELQAIRTQREHEGELAAALPSFAQIKAELRAQDRRITTLLHEPTRHLPETLSAEQASSLAVEDRHGLDSLYVAFEDSFRGTRADIKQRLEIYLPILREAGIGGSEMEVLDLGCGRGEWLELLREHGMHNSGIDANRAMITRCERHGLTAVHADGLGYLRSLAASSLGALTAFHVVEHLQSHQLLEVLDETMRVLKPGGLAIFETPNPANIQVGACTFYQDLTHVRPIPSNVLKFLAEARGMFRVEVLNLHPYPPENAIAGDERGLAQRFNQYFYGPQDYAIIGRKV